MHICMYVRGHAAVVGPSIIRVHPPIFPRPSTCVACLGEGVEEDEGRDEDREDLLLEERRLVLEERAQKLPPDFAGGAPV